MTLITGQFGILMLSICLIIIANFALPTQALNRCPIGCICISLKNAMPTSLCTGLKYIPKNIATNTEVLTMSSSLFDRITDEDFSNLRNLTRLNLEKNVIKEISDNAFLHLTQLKSLKLSKNYLKSISINVFRHLHNLEELHLDHNFLETLPEDLSSVLPNLKKLYLHSNRFDETTSASLWNFRNLEELVLSSNRFVSIEHHTFKKLRRLRSLNLDNNRIKFIHRDSFRTLSQLKQLHLHSNALHTLHKGIFTNNKNLLEVTLYKNPLNCDCNIRWIRDTMTVGKSLFKNQSQIACFAPRMLRGKAMMKLSQQDFGCLSNRSDWGSWSICSRKCGYGFQSRSRKCAKGSTLDRVDCIEIKKENRICNAFPCFPSSDAILTDWSTWSQCPDNCHSERTRERRCVNPSSRVVVNNCIGALFEREACNAKKCPVNGAWSGWSKWSGCDQQCKQRLSIRVRRCTNPTPRNGGALCDGGSEETEKAFCVCEKQGEWGEWSAFSRCSERCGTGRRSRHRFCLNKHSKKIMMSTDCVGTGTETVICHQRPCMGTGSWSPWSTWNQCDFSTCTKSRSRTCKTVQGESRCTGKSTNFKRCTRSECSIQSVWAAWGSWSRCSNSCNGGNRIRTRQCKGQHKFPVVVCGNQRREMEVCNMHACNQFNWGGWGEWSQCPDNLIGKQVRKRKCHQSRDNGRCNGKSKERRDCKVLLLINSSHGEGKKCQQRKNFPNGVEMINKTKNGFRAKYTCNKHYKLKGGPATMTCIDGKGWTSTNIPYCTPSCGKPVYGSTNHWLKRARLFGGKITVSHSWPWQVIIESIQDNKKWDIHCGGSLINDEWMVTAAHCLYNVHGDLYKPSEMKMYFGVHNMTERRTSKNVQTRLISYYIKHPDFDIFSLDNDIALIKLKKPVKINDKVLPVCLPSSKRKNLARVGQTGIVVGWGATSPTKKYSELLQELQLPVISHTNCVNLYRGQNSVTKSMFCAENLNQDTCKGDSGSGYIFHDPLRKRWTLQGIVSWGGSRNCGATSKPSVYTRVGMFTSWIRKVMRE